MWWRLPQHLSTEEISDREDSSRLSLNDAFGTTIKGTILSASAHFKVKFNLRNRAQD